MIDEQAKRTVGFYRLLNEQAEKLQLTLRDVANKTGYTYEHVRKVFNGGSFPSRFMLQELCKILSLPIREMEQMVISDRIKIKYGKHISTAYNHDSQMITYWENLTDDQRDAIRMLINGYVRQNELRKAG